MIDFIQIADAVKNLLKSGSYCMSPVIERVILPILTTQEQADKILKISVVPKEVDSEPASRAEDFNEYKVDIGIQKKVENIETEVPILLIFVKEILNFLDRKNLPTKAKAHYASMQNKPIYDVKQLAENKVFTTLITVTYKELD